MLPQGTTYNCLELNADCTPDDPLLDKGVSLLRVSVNRLFLDTAKKTPFPLLVSVHRKWADTAEGVQLNSWISKA